MFRLSIQLRQALSRLTLPSLMALACAVMLLGQADRQLAERARVAVSDAVAPLYLLLARPIDDLRGIGREARSLVGVARENERLRAENMRLRRWYDVAVALEAENATLKANLNWMPESAPSFVTARAVADASQFYARSILLAVPPGHVLSKDMVALDAAGLVGRVTEVGARSARVMLITDMTSRVPVTLEGSRADAIMTGTNAAAPGLMDYPEDIHPEEGERVVTSNVTRAFPAGLPVGTVHWATPSTAVVEPFARLDHVEIVRLFDYGLAAVTPPEAPGHVLPQGQGQQHGQRQGRSGPVDHPEPSMQPAAGAAVGRG